MHKIKSIRVGRGGGGGGGGSNLRGGTLEGTVKTISLNSILEFSKISDFKMKNIIIWH